MLFLNLSLKLCSKNKQYLKKFILLLQQYKIKCRLNLNEGSLSDIFSKKKLFSILKSPHVHKTAQEQFSLNSYSIFLQFLNLLQIEKFMLLLKNFHHIFFSLSLKFQLEFFFKRSLNKNMLVYSNFLPFFDIFASNKFLVIDSKFLVNFLKLLDTLGELKLLTYFK